MTNEQFNSSNPGAQLLWRAVDVQQLAVERRWPDDTCWHEGTRRPKAANDEQVLEQAGPAFKFQDAVAPLCMKPHSHVDNFVQTFYAPTPTP